MALMPRGQPRSVPDPYSDDYKTMLKKEAEDKMLRDAYSAAVATTLEPGFGYGLSTSPKQEDIRNISDGIEEFQNSKPIGHASALGSFIPFYGPARNSLADLQEKDYMGATLNGGLVVLDATGVAEIADLAGHGLLGTVGRQAWKYRRRSLGNSGFAAKGQDVHHAFIPQRSKWVPAPIMHHVLNLKPMASRAEHNLVHGKAVLGQRYNLAQRTFAGMPDWTKPFAASYAGRLLDQTSRFAQSHWPWAPPPQTDLRNRNLDGQ